MKKKRPNSKAKGGSFEREICSLLSQWWSGNEEETDLFWRTASSGGRATSRAKKQQQTRGHNGDICATCPESKPLIDLVTIEVKRGYASKSVMDLLDCSKSAAMQTYEEWFLQADRERKESGSKSWLIISKRDRRKTLVFFPWQLGASLRDVGAKLMQGRVTPWLDLDFHLGQELWSVHATHFSEFLRVVHPDDVRNALLEK